MGLFDDIFDDLCPSSLRIPPLQDPFPFPTITDKRPSPLEPNARTNSNIDKEAAKLTGRGKALAEAKPIGETENNELRPIHSTPRKRQKKYDTKNMQDFVQLPKPKVQGHDDKLPPFLPISVLNQLNEPPPSAALFPPITPNATQLQHDRRVSIGSIADAQNNDYVESKENGEVGARDEGNGAAVKRVYVRKRTKWSEEETRNLARGVDRFGVGKWTKILNCSDYTFSEGRTPLDLKDRFRTITGNSPAQPPEGGSYEDLLGFTTTGQSRDAEQTSSKKEPQQPRRKPKHSWSTEEDEGLVKGYQKHGFCWKDISNDPKLPLGNRSGPQIRDRFRKRFPELYGEAPAPAKEIQNPPNASTKPNTKDPSNTTSLNSLLGSELNRYIGDGAPNRRNAAAPVKQVASASAPHDINGLLNSDEQEYRQSSFRDEDWDQNVTLAPLQWEDLCTKPMFELD
ncbi:MAG: hypothetical protein LQ350_006889 [Teloschistes chrysophthalmus]|nr:MAG: hypothetical protein LQ350_006889 [Niorma chrysophthalma]